jgi:hypothetical protein
MAPPCGALFACTVVGIAYCCTELVYMGNGVPGVKDGDIGLVASDGLTLFKYGNCCGK